MNKIYNLLLYLQKFKTFFNLRLIQITIFYLSFINYLNFQKSLKFYFIFHLFKNFKINLMFLHQQFNLKKKLIILILNFYKSILSLSFDEKNELLLIKDYFNKLSKIFKYLNDNFKKSYKLIL